MKLYKGTICSMILVGTLNEPPICYKIDDETNAAEFFLTIYKSKINLNNSDDEEQFFLYRIIAKNAEAMKIKKLAQYGIQLFVEGELQGYHILKSNENNLVIAEIAANKLWLMSSPELNQLKMEKDGTHPGFLSENIFDVCKSMYVH